ncbi:metallophosphoesterase [Fictibacillus nanhaiensis]|uniref:metallophosphoesterase n=1 Tax=Fictibacillus nanhaiensis TaxID=742169 RepID=UPI001C971249|nr:metallophosphoesterase [Fictibacillus nanhaiensis]MBY6036636.1 metallophosphoesterase [Fictibacillus nanhaiensis]
MNSKQVNRRDFIKIGGASTLALTLGSLGNPATLLPTTVHADDEEEKVLRFHPDGTFKVVQFNDTQDDERIDRRTIELMENVLDAEKPDFVVLNGDNITGGCDTALEMKQAMNNIAQPMEKRGIKWAVTFGNHDEDSTVKSGIDEESMLKFYRSYKHNVNGKGAKDITGTGNMNLLIWDDKAKKAAFNLWLLDSGRYAPKTIAGQDFEGYPTWDWLRFDQVSWYNETSKKMEKRFGYKVPSLMFIHIPLWEHRYMWFASAERQTEADHARAVEKHQITGERNEEECPGPINSGLFSAMLQRGDVKGVFCGHDHINTYAGNYYGIMLGYGGSAGFGTYGLPGADKNKLRGARVFNLDLHAENVLAETHMVFAKDYGIDLTANDQSMEPSPFEDKKKKVEA